MAIIENVSEAARIAGPSEDVSLAELQLAARNHGLPLEALRYDVTPAGLHYLLVHYDIPLIDLHLTAAAATAVPRPRCAPSTASPSWSRSASPAAGIAL